MTRPAQSALVVDGETVRLRLRADRAEGQSVIHVDWLRFTTCLREAPFDLDLMFPPALEHATLAEANRARVDQVLRDLANTENFSPAAQALSLAREVVEVLGAQFSVAAEIRKGHDFYGHRWSIEFEGKECGWVGFGASGTSPRQRRQAETIHVNLYGTACTFARPGWQQPMAELVDRCDAHITRVDLAADFFDGYQGGIQGVFDGYKLGACDVGGKRPAFACHGDWANGAERSIYIGSREAGKQTNVYEKGHQLYGRESGCNWLRFELRYGNKLRDLPSDVLRNPDGFFAGASDWHACVLRELRADVGPQKIATKQRLEAETVDAEVHRNLTWLERTAAPTVAAALEFLSLEKLLSLVEFKRLPGRLSKYPREALRGAFDRALTRFPVGDCPLAV